MKKLLLLPAFLLAGIVMLPAQNRVIARGAEPGELYLSTGWYGLYAPIGPPYYLEFRKAVVRFTENGQKAQIIYDKDIANEDGDMQPGYVIADAAPGVLYNKDIEAEIFWVSFDYGKTWIFREDFNYPVSYYGSNFEGLLYRGGRGGYKSEDYGFTWKLIENVDPPYFCEAYFKKCELLSIIGRGFYYTNDCFQNFINITIEPEYVFGQMGGLFPDVFRGAYPGEVYVTLWFPDWSYKASFSADTGQTFRTAYHSDSLSYEKGHQFMSDRAVGAFYIASFERIETADPWGWHTRIRIEHYTEYGETLAGSYCHDLTKEWGAVGMGGLDTDGGSYAISESDGRGIEDSRFKI